jgi:hypothetical protein
MAAEARSGKAALAKAVQRTLPAEGLRSAAAHQNRALLRGVMASAGIRLRCADYHPAQSQGHIKAVTVARMVQNAIHNQRFCLGVMEQETASPLCGKPTPTV